MSLLLAACIGLVLILSAGLCDYDCADDPTVVQTALLLALLVSPAVAIVVGAALRLGSESRRRFGTKLMNGALGLVVAAWALVLLVLVGSVLP